MLSRSFESFRWIFEESYGLWKLEPTAPSIGSGGGDSASGMGDRAGGTIVNGGLPSVDGISILSSSCLIGSGGVRLVEIECQIAISNVMVHTATTVMRIIRAVVGIMVCQRTIVRWVSRVARAACWSEANSKEKIGRNT